MLRSAEVQPLFWRFVWRQLSLIPSIPDLSSLPIHLPPPKQQHILPPIYSNSYKPPPNKYIAITPFPTTTNPIQIYTIPYHKMCGRLYDSSIHFGVYYYVFIALLCHDNNHSYLYFISYNIHYYYKLRSRGLEVAWAQGLIV